MIIVTTTVMACVTWVSVCKKIDIYLKADDVFIDIG